MVFIPFLIVAYIGFFLVAAYVQKSKRRTILWTGALILFFSIMLLMGLGVFTPSSWVEIVSTILALISSGMLACLAETKFPEQRRDGTRQKPESIQEVSHDDALEESSNVVQLTGKLDTPLASQVFDKALGAGLMEKNGEHYKWKGSKVQLAYICGRIYCEDKPKYDVREAKYFWKFGRTEFFPESDLNELFEVTDLAQSRQNRKDSPVPQGSDKIDELF